MIPTIIFYLIMSPTILICMPIILIFGIPSIIYILWDKWKTKRPCQKDEPVQVAEAENPTQSIPTTQFRVVEPTRVTSNRLGQQPPAALPFIPPAGWNPTPIIPFYNDGLPVSTETPLASRNKPLITPVISHVTSPNRAVETDRVPPFALEQQPLNTQSKKTPPQRKTRKPSEVTTQSIADLSPAEEGGRKPRTSYAIVRSAKLRKAAIQIHGRNCIACGLSFDERYGEDLAKGYIDIHHLNSISAGVRNTDPAKDLVPLCRNCHVMADRLARHHTSPPRSIGELKNMLFPKFRFQEKEAIPAVKADKSPVKTRITKVRENKPKKSS